MGAMMNSAATLTSVITRPAITLETITVFSENACNFKHGLTGRNLIIELAPSWFIELERSLLL